MKSQDRNCLRKNIRRTCFFYFTVKKFFQREYCKSVFDVNIFSFNSHRRIYAVRPLYVSFAQLQKDSV